MSTNRKVSFLDDLPSTASGENVNMDPETARRLFEIGATLILVSNENMSSCFSQEPILRLLNLQLQRQRCGRLQRLLNLQLQRQRCGRLERFLYRTIFIVYKTHYVGQ
jgi:hypothetical protein